MEDPLVRKLTLLLAPHLAADAVALSGSLSLNSTRSTRQHDRRALPALATIVDVSPRALAVRAAANRRPEHAGSTRSGSPAVFRDGSAFACRSRCEGTDQRRSGVPARRAVGLVARRRRSAAGVPRLAHLFAGPVLTHLSSSSSSGTRPVRLRARHTTRSTRPSALSRRTLPSPRLLRLPLLIRARTSTMRNGLETLTTATTTAAVCSRRRRSSTTGRRRPRRERRQLSPSSSTSHRLSQSGPGAASRRKSGFASAASRLTRPTTRCPCRCPSRRPSPQRRSTPRSSIKMATSSARRRAPCRTRSSPFRPPRTRRTRPRMRSHLRRRRRLRPRPTRLRLSTPTTTTPTPSCLSRHLSRQSSSRPRPSRPTAMWPGTRLAHPSGPPVAAPLLPSTRRVSVPSLTRRRQARPPPLLRRAS
ncbi:hypothetical protein DMC30DRAFT_185362 [Rhodotorula diobovata]|uniref:Uncharacterized protein n=1 Tax=Rhodotorula diobovata TaxID=5288 RepID=A0A5C5FZJ0_9BASI|nr:hypothetical protein DMC30DRAFT_185362 [Rhodotorula diobovata]